MTSPASVAWVVFPRGVNWFYERAAHRLGEVVRSCGFSARLCAAADLEAAEEPAGPGPALIISIKECVDTLPRRDKPEAFLARLAAFPRRILVNYDCVYAEWFRKQFTAGGEVITEVADVNVVPQTDQGSVAGLPYRWIPETLTLEEQASARPWSPGRPAPWALVAHSATSACARTALLDALVRDLSPGGVAFLPSLRPYREGSGALTERSLDRILQHADVYVWNSHHQFPFHEAMRAPQAIRNGAIPAKIDPLFADRFAEVPWVFPDVASLRSRLSELGARELYERSRAFLLRHSMEAAMAGLINGEASSSSRATA